MKIKYPKSWHIYYSEKLTSGDRKHTNDDHLKGNEVVVTIKKDGENTSIYSDTIHARSLDSGINSEDRRWVDELRVAKIHGKIPNTYRVCGENMFYRHTCKYEILDSLFYVFSIWDGDTCLSWKDTEMWCKKLELEHVYVIYKGIYDKEKILEEFKKYSDISENDVEGFVIRTADSFNIKDFKWKLNKFVNKSFQIGDAHWRHSKKTINGLKNNVNPWDIIWS